MRRRTATRAPETPQPISALILAAETTLPFNAWCALHSLLKVSCVAPAFGKYWKVVQGPFFAYVRAKRAREVGVPVSAVLADARAELDAAGVQLLPSQFALVIEQVRHAETALPQTSLTALRAQTRQGFHVPREVLPDPRRWLPSSTNGAPLTMVRFARCTRAEWRHIWQSRGLPSYTLAAHQARGGCPWTHEWSRNVHEDDALDRYVVDTEALSQCRAANEVVRVSSSKSHYTPWVAVSWVPAVDTQAWLDAQFAKRWAYAHLDAKLRRVLPWMQAFLLPVNSWATACRAANQYAAALDVCT